jgi:hypothetical protein
MFHANVVVSLDDQHTVIFHTSKEGLRIPKIVQRALKRSESKWGNSSAMARIILGEMTAHDPMGLDGFGVVPEVVDNNNYILTINDRIQKIGIMTELQTLIKVWTFEQYLALPGQMEWQALHYKTYDRALEECGAGNLGYNLTAGLARRSLV